LHSDFEASSAKWSLFYLDIVSSKNIDKLVVEIIMIRLEFFGNEKA